MPQAFLKSFPVFCFCAYLLGPHSAVAENSYAKIRCNGPAKTALINVRVEARQSGSSTRSEGRCRFENGHVLSFVFGEVESSKPYNHIVVNADGGYLIDFYYVDPATATIQIQYIADNHYLMKECRTKNALPLECNRFRFFADAWTYFGTND